MKQTKEGELKCALRSYFSIEEYIKIIKQQSELSEATLFLPNEIIVSIYLSQVKHFLLNLCALATLSKY